MDRLLMREYDDDLDVVRRALQTALEFTIDPDRTMKDVAWYAGYALRNLDRKLGPQPAIPTERFDASDLTHHLLNSVYGPGPVEVDLNPDYDYDLHRVRGFILDALGALAVAA